jgi:Flp pilus assembly protein TadG
MTMLSRCGRGIEERARAARRRVAWTWICFKGDRDGATAVQALVMLPAILFAFVMLIVLWQTLMIRRSLHHGVYEATRYLSLYPPNSVSPTPWETVATEFVLRELANNPFADTTGLSSPARFELTVELIDGGYACKQKFRVRAKYAVLRAIPSLEGTNFVLPSLTPAYLQEERVGEVLCE